MFIHILVLSSIARFTSVYGRHNLTVDDPDPAIIYAPANSWTLSANNSLNAGGAHMLTQDRTATATFTFTGVAIYYMSPKWPYLVNTAISLDSGPPVLVDLVDHSRPGTGEGPETVQSQIVWGASGLTNTQHKLVMSVGAGQPFAIVDTLIYTVLDPEDTATASATSASASTRTRSSTSSSSSPASTSSAATPSSSARVLPIALGTVFGVLALLIIAVVLWFYGRRRERPVSEAWTVAGHPYPSNPEMSPVAGPNGVSNYYGHPYNPYPSDNGWGASQYGYGAGGPTTAPPPGAMSVAGPASMGHPYTNPTGVVPMPQQLRAPNRYQPNTLSTITETSTPPVGGGTPLAYSPSSPGTEIYHDAPSSLPSGSPYQSYAGGSGELPRSQDPRRPPEKPMPRYPPPYTPH